MKQTQHGNKEHTQNNKHEEIALFPHSCSESFSLFAYETRCSKEFTLSALAYRREECKMPQPKALVALRATYSRVMQQFYGKRTYPSPNTRITQKRFAAKIIGTLAIRGTAALRCMPPRARAKDNLLLQHLLARCSCQGIYL